MNTIRQYGGIHVVQLGDRFHVVQKIDSQVFSVMPSDMPDSGSWMARANDSGAAYVSRGRTRAGAMAGFRRETRRGD